MWPPYRELKTYPDWVVIQQSIIVGSRRTSLRLSKDLLLSLHDIAEREGLTLNALCTGIAEEKPQRMNLTEAVRSYVVRYFRVAATEEGHQKAGHGRKRMS
jgi:predicted DNA-binding ribbon-helix-helix protein